MVIFDQREFSVVDSESKKIYYGSATFCSSTGEGSTSRAANARPRGETMYSSMYRIFLSIFEYLVCFEYLRLSFECILAFLRVFILFFYFFVFLMRIFEYLWVL